MKEKKTADACASGYNPPLVSGGGLDTPLEPLFELIKQYVSNTTNAKHQDDMPSECSGSNIIQLIPFSYNDCRAIRTCNTDCTSVAP